VSEARCSVCGRTFLRKTGSHRFCSAVCRERSRALQPGRRARYSFSHQELRRRVGRLVVAGAAVCSRCGEPIDPGEPWDLDHEDNGVGYRGPSHAACNRATAKAREEFVDDPERGVFWGPPGVDGKPTRWSRAWFDWRGEQQATEREEQEDE
jgi:hypothetical protein